MTPKVRPSAKINILEKYKSEVRGENPRNYPLRGVAVESRNLAPEFQAVSRDRRRFGEKSRSEDSGAMARGFALERYRKELPRESAAPSGPLQIFSLARDFARRAFEAWSRGPHGMLFMGAGFLLGAGTPRRYFEIDHSYQIQMEKGDAAFVLGGKVAGSEMPDLVLEGGAPLAARQVEIFRMDQELYVRDLTGEGNNWICHEYKWKRLEPGQTEQLRASDALVLGLEVEPSQFQEKEPDRQPAVLTVDFADSQSSFRLRKSQRGFVNWGPGYPYFVSGYPVFGPSPEVRRGEGRSQFRLSWGQRWDLWRSRGSDRVRVLVNLAEQYFHEMPQEMQRKFLDEAVSLAQQLEAKLRGKKPEAPARLRAGLNLVRVQVSAATYWNHKGDSHLAAQFYENALAVLDSYLPVDVEAKSWQGMIGEKLHSLHEWTAGAELGRGRRAAAARHYEGAAKYVSWVKPLGPDDESPPGYKDPLTALEYLSLAAGNYLQAGPEYTQDLLRVTQEIHALQEAANSQGPFR